MVHEENLRRFSTVSAIYDNARPRPPEGLADFLLEYRESGGSGDSVALRPRVLDLGAGTGLSTAIWRSRASSLVAVEPNEAMRQVFVERLPEVPLLPETSDALSLPAASVDIVTISQAFHWMEPDSTLREIWRILAPGGMLAVYDCDWPVMVHPGLDSAAAAFFSGLAAHRRARPDLDTATHYAKQGHLDSLRRFGCFGLVTEALYLSRESCDLDRYLNIAASQGGYARLREAGLSEQDLGMHELRGVAEDLFGRRPVRPMFVNYRIRLGLRLGNEW